LSDKIINEVKDYINNVIRPPREEFGGMPTCPFAGPELDSGRLMIDVIYPGGATLPELIHEFINSDYNSALFAQISDEQLSAEDTKQYQKFINRVLKKEGASNYKVICFNPNDSITNVNGFNARALAPYFLINIADKKELGRAHKTLMKTKYFDKLNEAYLKYLHVDPKSLNKSECASSKKRT
tara:strand:- start:113 stop:661 length:549 start_codon:yes stop_codon:yes gene_type:complete